VDRKDTGIILAHPSISEGEYIKLDIYQEISAIKDFSDPKRRHHHHQALRQDLGGGEGQRAGGHRRLIAEAGHGAVDKGAPGSATAAARLLFKSKSTKREKTNLLITCSAHRQGRPGPGGVSARQSEAVCREERQSRMESPTRAAAATMTTSSIRSTA